MTILSYYLILLIFTISAASALFLGLKIIRLI
uniref:Cytochrome b6-f complex subunit 6 n=1 Tax=Eustigmatophyceae sp. Mont 10/10-1w TaxID=2506145 RepID=A0A3R5T9A8_9STRA|nr:cytochrome b6-f complex subunit 6 [Eustigmatophyceae sp. Mont 10/10-1w]QAA11762.1 cytochrome b6-f complex subunit 6 [Eustigmatophyceae sp. Mont 10/10-1w]